MFNTPRTASHRRSLTLKKAPRLRSACGAMNGLPAYTGQDYDSSRCRSDGAQIFRRGLARPSISNNVEGHLLSFVKAMHPGAFDCADVHEDILAAIIRLDEAEAFLAVEPLHGSLRHLTLPSGRCVKKAARRRSRFVRDLEKSRQSDAGCAARPSRSAEARWGNMGHCGLERKVHAESFDGKRVSQLEFWPP